MKVRRRSPICQAIETDGTATIYHKGKPHKVPASHELILPDGSRAITQSLRKFRVVQKDPLLVQRIFPIEEAIRWHKHDDHPMVRRVQEKDLHDDWWRGKPHLEKHGILVTAIGESDVHEGDFIIKNPDNEIRRFTDLHYEVVEA